LSRLADQCTLRAVTGRWGLLYAVALGATFACGSSSDETGTTTSGGGASSGGTGGAQASGGTTSGGGTTSSGGTSTGGSAGSDGGGAAGSDAGVDAPSDGPFTAKGCLAGQFVNQTDLGPDYDQYDPVIGSHCKGTNMQDIKGVQRVVFLGDSITVGTPPTDLNPAAVYRAILAQKLATLFNITPPGLGWGAADIINGVALPAESGDFVSCAKWGARTDDLMKDSTQVEDCIPPDKRNLHHLVIMTMGGNDIDAITKDGGGTNPAKTIPQLWADTQAFIDNLRNAVTWMKDPNNVPGGVDVVFSNNYEFTDGTGDVASCPASGIAQIQPWTDLQAQVDMVVYAEEQYLKIAVDTKSDMIFMLESFCGHGYKRDDPTSPCYRGPNQPLWFDLTCIHPNNDGHAALADLFYQTIAE
jgi:lysophospholipase L1-like esterase